MSHTHISRRRAESIPAEQTEYRTDIPGPSLQELVAGAQPSRAQMGHRVDLPEAIRAKMEASFGADFSNVRLYESQTVADAGAKAVTMGGAIGFAPGKLDFASTGGQALLGHELSHVVSQARGEASGRGYLQDHALEARADREGALAAAGEQVYTGPVTPLSASSISASTVGVAQAKESKDEKNRKKEFLALKYQRKQSIGDVKKLMAHAPNNFGSFKDQEVWARRGVAMVYHKKLGDLMSRMSPEELANNADLRRQFVDNYAYLMGSRKMGEYMYERKHGSEGASKDLEGEDSVYNTYVERMKEYYGQQGQEYTAPDEYINDRVRELHAGRAAYFKKVDDGKKSDAPVRKLRAGNGNWDWDPLSGKLVGEKWDPLSGEFAKKYEGKPDKELNRYAMPAENYAEELERDRRLEEAERQRSAEREEARRRQQIEEQKNRERQQQAREFQRKAEARSRDIKAGKIKEEDMTLLELAQPIAPMNSTAMSSSVIDRQSSDRDK